jgi:hypothetical protein
VVGEISIDGGRRQAIERNTPSGMRCRVIAVSDAGEVVRLALYREDGKVVSVAVSPAGAVALSP